MISAPSTPQVSSQTTPFHSASLYVGDLAPEINEGALFEIFNQVGPVASIRVCRDTITRRSLGYAYVNFHNVSDAERALDTMNFSLIKDIPCRIMWSQRDPSMRRSGVGNVFVKNLDESVDNKALYDTFSLFGNILSCKVVTDADSKSKGYGYVHYETAESANGAISKIDGMEIAGKKVHVGHFVRRNDRAGQADWTNVYVKNIPRSWDEGKLKLEFGKFGNITSIKIQKEATEQGMVSKGFGFVNFDDHDSAEKAIKEMNGTTVTGPVQTKGETASEEEDQQEEVRELFCCRALKKIERQRELQQKYEVLKIERINRYQGINVYVKNIDESLTDEQLKENFALFGMITSARVMRDPATGNSKGFGFVCFSSPEEANNAILEMNNKVVASKPIYVALAQRKDVRRAQLEAQFAQRGIIGQRGVTMGLVQPGMYGMGMMPFMMPGTPGGVPQMSRTPSYPLTPNMIPRGVPRGTPMQSFPGRAPYPMPSYAMGGMQMQNQQQQRRTTINGNNRGRMINPPGSQSGLPAPGINGGPGSHNRLAMPMMQQQGVQRGAGGLGGGPPGQQLGGFKYTQQVRNQPNAMMQQKEGNSMQGLRSESLTAQALAAASPEMQKNMIGERLYPLIHQMHPNLAGKITGMLLEMDNGELLHLLESPEALKSKVYEALQVLETHSIDG
mmetsp:Transcript_14251/g.21091  ORF Transcript_14251/g.21091 Transcript_14251/m.21091 type:complete len:675 (+) Transcript_14251:93-2117(+)